MCLDKGRVNRLASPEGYLGWKRKEARFRNIVSSARVLGTIGDPWLRWICGSEENAVGIAFVPLRLPCTKVLFTDYF